MAGQNFDILIAGAGLAGFSAGVRAAENGAKVLLIDKSDGALGGGNVLMASGSLRTGGKSPRTNPAELFNFVMAEGVAYPALVQAWADTSSRAVDWLKSVGVEIEENANGRVWLKQESEISYGPVYKKDVGPRAVNALKQRFEKLGGVYRNQTAAVQLIREQNRICGVLARSSGDVTEIRAGSTLLTTGGFSANRDLVRQHIGPQADRCKLRGSDQDTGDGLRMALAAGAKAVNLQYFYGHLISRRALTDDRFWPYPRLDSFIDEGILVDKEGKRFVDEGRGDVAVANVIARRDDPTDVTLIFDDASWVASRDNPSSTSLAIPAPNPWLKDNDGELFVAETVENLATLIGVAAASLAATINQYNAAVASANLATLPVERSGNSKTLQPPYYGLKVVPGITFTMGGVLINGKGEVLDESENPIAGLFAAGDAIGGLMGGYRGGYMGGLMQAIVTGILAGENAASTKK